MKNRLLVTAALPYANGPIHLGHIAGAYLPADIFVRFNRSLGRDVLFICGSDEHGVPITLTADKENITPQDVVDRFHSANKKAFEKLGMSFDNYSRTSLQLHHETAQEFFLKFYEEGILNKKSEFQFYDEKSKKFLPDRYVKGICPNCKNDDARGDQCESCGTYLNPSDLIEPKSRISGEVPVLKETWHWYFPLGQYQKRLEDYIKEKDDEIGWRENVLNYCNSWFKEGLQDRAVTRDLDWGVKLPIDNAENKVLYVWFDAVLGYISATKEHSINVKKPDLWKEYWLKPDTEYYAFIGKDNVVFHCIVFPAMLMAWNDSNKDKYILPDNVPANEFLNYENLKFSKSRGWGIDVQDFLEKFSPDTLRYYLSTILPENRDSDFFWKEFQARYNNELADIFGNFINRTLTFLEKHFNSTVPQVTNLREIDTNIIESLKEFKLKIENSFRKVKLKEAIIEIMNLARSANKYFNDSEPWKTVKDNKEVCAATVYTSVQIIRSLTIALAPILPFSSAKIFKILNIHENDDLIKWDSFDKILIQSDSKLNKAEILFKKIEDKEIEPLLPNKEESDNTLKIKSAEKQKISIEDFKKIEIKTGRVVDAVKVKKSDKLLKLQVDLGSEIRQVISGIAKHYSEEQILGRKVLVVTNLEKATLMGEVSDGMVLAVEEGKTLKVISPGDDIPLGVTLR